MATVFNKTTLKVLFVSPNDFLLINKYFNPKNTIFVMKSSFSKTNLLYFSEKLPDNYHIL